jgi:DNA-binding MarR family transcriptional regulator
MAKQVAGAAHAVYVEMSQIAERAHRGFMDTVQADLSGTDFEEVNPVQAMIAYHLLEHGEVSVGDLTAKELYLGSNVSYNVRKMKEQGLVKETRSVHDRRSYRISLEPKGRKLAAAVEKSLERRAGELERVAPELREALKVMESASRAWQAVPAIS